jgi:hypothetical protein
MSRDLNDDLDGLFNGSDPAPVVRAPSPPRLTKDEIAEHAFVEKCPSCGGSGKFRSWSGRTVGDCFKCKGRGSRTFATSPEQRASGRQAAADRRERQEVERAETAQAWIAEHKAEHAWLVQAAAQNERRGGTFDFPQKLLDAIQKFGGLSEREDGGGQLATVRRLMVRDAAREAERQAAKKDVDASKITAAFELARQKANRPGALGIWTRPLPLTSSAATGTQTIVFQAGKGKWEGWLFVEEHGTGLKLGNIRDGKFSAKFHCTPAHEAAVLEVASDPSTAAKAFGKAWSCCCVCGRTLTNDGSIEAGIGPICAERFGF